MPTALITGSTGQDGLYLSRHLNSLGYEVIAVTQFGSSHERQLVAAHGGNATVRACDITDLVSVTAAIRETRPDEIYNLAAISSVRASWDQPMRTCEVNGLGPLTILEAIRLADRVEHTRVFQASSAQLFGDVATGSFDETTPIQPNSPYGASKALAHFLAASYRHRYGMFVSCGILGNHESSLHDQEFVVPRIVRTVARIATGQAHELVLDNLTAERDWGFAGDFVAAMHLCLQHPTPEDFVIATGELHTVEDAVQAAFHAAGIVDWQPMVRLTGADTGQAQRVPRADISKTRQRLGWKPTVSFAELIEGMVTEAIATEANGAVR
jgi:GDPmannose 4,6-dehydratase